jgi:hypothetical protein
MAMADNVLFLDDARGREEAGPRHEPSRVAERRRHVTEMPHPAEPGLAEAAELIAALSGLVERGLVVVHDEAGGPARYGIGDGLGGVA